MANRLKCLGIMLLNGAIQFPSSHEIWPLLKLLLLAKCMLGFLSIVLDSHNMTKLGNIGETCTNVSGNGLLHFAVVLLKLRHARILCESNLQR